MAFDVLVHTDRGIRRLTRILIVDDYAAWRNYVCSALAKEPQFEVVATVSDGQKALRTAQEFQPDIIILDVGLPGLNGIEVARSVLHLLPCPKILFLSEDSSPDIVQEALATGANGYVLKSHAASDLLAGVKAVLSGQVFVSQILAHRIFLN